jgi:hypothetical protein
MRLAVMALLYRSHSLHLNKSQAVMQLIQAKSPVVEALIIMAGETDMPKRIDNNKFIHASAIAIAISLASCGRVEPVPESGAMPSSMGANQYSIPEPLGTVLLAAEAGEPAQVERRHFAIYSAYRVLFDDSPDVFRSRANGEGFQQAVMNDGDIGGLADCSMRALLLQD